jgi:hypothetical protein
VQPTLTERQDTDGLDSQDSILAGARFFLFSTASRPSPIQGIPGTISPGVKRPGREGDHSPPSSAEVKNGLAIPSLSHMSSWHNVH